MSCCMDCTYDELSTIANPNVDCNGNCQNKTRAAEAISKTSKRAEHFRMKSSKVMLCPIIKCKKKYKYAAALENHLIKYHRIEITNGFCKPNESYLRNEDFPPKLKRIMDNFASVGEFLMQNQSQHQEYKPVKNTQTPDYKYIPQNRTQVIKLKSPSFFPEEDQEVITSPQHIRTVCSCSSCFSSDEFPRAPSPGLKVYYLNELGKSFDNFNYCLE